MPHCQKLVVCGWLVVSSKTVGRCDGPPNGFRSRSTTAARWAGRYRDWARPGMVDRSSRPHRSPSQTPTRTERRIIKVRVLRRWGPARIGYLLGLHPSTVHRVLTRYGLAKLRWLDRPTGRVIRRMESAHCGDLVHVDVKKLGKIPAGGGWRMLGRTAGNHNARADKSSGVEDQHRQPVRGYHFLHTAIDGHSRLAYSELLADERKETAAAFWLRANAWFTDMRHHSAKSVDRQRLLLPITRFPRRARRYRAPPHPALSAPDQRQSGAIPPHPGRRMGLRPALPQRRRTLRGVPTLATHLQSPPRPHRTRRPTTRHPRT